MIKISVIVPVYNVEAYLRKCLDSLVNQTLKEIEIIIVDDGSTDSSSKIAEEYSKKYNQIRFYTKKNGGLSDARNYGLSYVQGEYVGFVDSDDYVELNMYEKLYQKALADDSQIVECNLFHDYKDDYDIEIGKEYQDKDEILMLGRSVVWNKIYKSDWLKSSEVLFPKGLIYEDVDFFSKLIPHLTKISYVKEPLIHYVQRGSSINNFSTYQKTSQILLVLKDVYHYYKKYHYFEKYKDALEFLFIRILLCSSLERMSKIPNKEQRKQAINENWQLLNKAFPKWKKNRYLKMQNSIKGIYMKSTNKVTYKFYAFLLHFIFILKSKKGHMYQ